jgi:hypothetical protein
MEETVKALLASALTALVLVTTAWASNVTPGQLAALSKRVTKLESSNAALARQVTCLRVGWNAQSYQAYALYTSDGFGTDSGDLTMLVSPSAPDGITGAGYLVASAAIGPQC